MDEGAFVIICLVFGFAQLVFRKHLARRIIREQNDFFGFGFGEREEKGSRYVIVLGGTLSIVLGILVLFDVL